MSSPWNRLPTPIQETILSLLPISTLLVCKTVSRSWKSTIESETFVSSYTNPTLRYQSQSQDLFFLLFTDLHHPNLVSAYHPSRDRWLSFPLLQDFSRVHVSSGALLMVEHYKGSLLVSDLFSRTYRPLPSMIPMFQPYALALIGESLSGYKIVVVSTVDRVYSQVYDSRTDRWKLEGQFAGQFAVLGNSVVLEGFLFCLSRGPDHLLRFDLIRGVWCVVDVAMPSVVCSHLLVYKGELFLVGGVEEVGVIVRVGIWCLDRPEREWRVICFMPDEFFSNFGEGGLNHFEVVDRLGKICFYNAALSLVLMCDMSEKKWWWPQSCSIPKNRRCWFGHSLEPHVDLIK